VGSTWSNQNPFKTKLKMDQDLTKIKLTFWIDIDLASLKSIWIYNLSRIGLKFGPRTNLDGHLGWMWTWEMK
jgi:hypothetical protein